MPRLIVMMPVKNVQGMVASAISSTLKSMPSDAQIVVWDDGSVDDTRSVVSKYVGPRVRLMVSEESVGGGAARDAIIDATDSEFVAAMDGDDVCMPWRFRTQMAKMDEFDCVFMTHFKFGAKLTDFRPALPLTYSAIDSALALIFHNPLTQSTFLGRRHVLDQVGGYRDLKVAQDYDLWMRIAAGGYKIGRLGLAGIGYRQSSTQISKQEGYVERIRKQTQIVESFTSLLDYLSPGLAEIATSQNVEATRKSDMISLELRRSLPRMSHSLRPYYRHLLDTGRMGPLWEWWSMERTDK